MPEAFRAPALKSARSAYEKGQIVDALRQCKIAEKSSSTRLVALKAEAELFRQAAYLDLEISTLRRCAIASSTDADSWLKLCYIYIGLGWMQEASEASDRALRIEPANPRVRVARAVVLYRSTTPAAAIPFAYEAVRLAPASSEYQNLLANILLKSQRYAEAEAVLHKALTADPTNLANRISLAGAFLAQNRLPEAEAEFTAILQREPGQVDATYALGDLSERRGKVDEALVRFEAVAKQDITYSNVAWRLGRLYNRKGRLKEGGDLIARYAKMMAATRVFENSLTRLRVRPNDPDIHLKLAQYHVDAAEIPQAIAELRRVLEMRPGNPDALRKLAQALANSGRVTEARQLSGTLRVSER